MITIYTYDANRVFTGSMDFDPKDRVPNGALEAPPTITGNEVAQWTGSSWAILAEYPTPFQDALEQRQSKTIELVKVERDRRAKLGVKVGNNWFHSDTDSRVQQIGLAMMGANVPPVPWKTKTKTGPTVYVTMTPAIAGGIFQNTAASDIAIFAAAETHIAAIKASETPEGYDISSGWPAAFGDAE